MHPDAAAGAGVWLDPTDVKAVALLEFAPVAKRRSNKLISPSGHVLSFRPLDLSRSGA